MNGGCHRRGVRIFILLGCACAVAGCVSAASEPPALMQPGALETLPARPADHRIRYGEHPSQYGDLRLPSGNGPHPVVVLIHGGCWKQQYASLRDLAPMADALKDSGIATWNVEYRRLPEPGSGWPGTYLDIASAIDHLRSMAAAHPLDLSRVVVVGHSAGGHLAHWAGARARLSAASPLYSPNPLPLRGIVNLAGRIDMTAEIAAYETLCRDSVVRDLLGGDPQALPERYNDVSPMKLLPLGVPQMLIWGEHEDYVRAPLAEAYVAAARAAGDDARLITVPRAGHFETASPRSAAWPVVSRTIESLLRRGN